MMGIRIPACLLLLVQLASCDDLSSSAHLPAEHRGGGGSGGPLLGGLSYGVPPFGPPHPDGYGPPPSVIGADPWLLPAPDMPQIRNIEVQCEKSNMRVSVDFDRPFYGMIFSKGHYSDPSCVHMQPGSGALNAQFEIYLNSCGMAASDSGGYGQPNPAGSFVENTIIIQYDPLVQEVWDQARKLRCTWYDYYEKKVTFKPFQVDMLNAVTANFLGDNLQCWMQIQVGKGPWASEVSGIVKIGQTMTMVLAIKDDENKFDMLVRNCVAHDGHRAPIQLVDANGCVTRPKVMSKFQKIKNFGSSASVVSYAYFQAFKFPDSMNVHFQCVIQVCRYQCPEPACGALGYEVGPRHPAGDYQAAGSDKEASVAEPRPAETDTNEGAEAARAAESHSHRRRRRDAPQSTDVRTERVIQVVAPGDVAFSLNANNETVVVSESPEALERRHSICMSVPGFVAGLIMLLLVLIVACIVSIFLFSRVRTVGGKAASFADGVENPEFVKGSE
ncbi:uncharacterized protein LOC119097490 [Pollicipes pollicipes]|uniref:uncharacterized protein LOC119097490 n=1 Tax=Pollicipes pollicipes TaxID=41117 RepID=UPI001884EADE|nr:uncharacterized protein LOC119097490 [Pollicipes pollicipes]